MLLAVRGPTVKGAERSAALPHQALHSGRSLLQLLRRPFSSVPTPISFLFVRILSPFVLISIAQIHR